MPDYGIAPVGDGCDLLPWSWAVERLQSAHNYWVATCSASTPHLAAVWGVWLNESFVFSTSGRSRKARDLAGNPRCSVAPDNATESLVLNGRTYRITEPDAIEAITYAYVMKYGAGFPDVEANPLLRVQPETVIAVIERGEEFTTRATRWTFPLAPA
jgi:hypothetical protein